MNDTITILWLKMDLGEIYLLKHFGAQNPRLKNDVLEVGLDELFADDYINQHQHEHAVALLELQPDAVFQPFQEALPWLVQNQLISEDDAESYGYALIAMSWMFACNLVAEDEVKHFLQDCLIASDDADMASIITCLASPDKQADPRLPGILAQKPLRLLRAENLITEAQLRNAQSLLDTKPPLKPRSFADVWQWLLWHDVVSKSAADQAIRALTQAHPDNIPVAIARLKELHGIAPVEIDAQIHRLQARRKKAKRLKVLLIGLGILVFGVYSWRPSAAPLCDSERVSSTLSELIAEQRSAALNDNLMLASMLDGRLSGEREVGYQRETRMRGCLVDLTKDELTFPIGFVIYPNEEDSDSFFLRLHSSSYIETNFSAPGQQPAQP